MGFRGGGVGSALEIVINSLQELESSVQCASFSHHSDSAGLDFSSPTSQTVQDREQPWYLQNSAFPTDLGNEEWPKML